MELDSLREIEIRLLFEKRKAECLTPREIVVYRPESDRHGDGNDKHLPRDPQHTDITPEGD